MRLMKLLKNLEIVKMVGFKNYNIKSVTHISSDVEKNSMFICIKGNNYDGNDYAQVAISCGAKCIVSDKDIDIKNATLIIVKDVRIAMSIIAKNLYNGVCEKLKIVGIIGTSGKTTSSILIANILKENGENVGIIGTNGIFIGDVRLDNKFTTPDPLELHYIFYHMSMLGVKTVVMEISAQAIYLNKMYGVNIDIGVFTNISKEHLDFFGSMENYVRCKLNYFNKKNMKEAVINVDDFYGMELAYKSQIPCITYALKAPANSFAIDIDLDIGGTKFVANILDDIFDVSSIMCGEFNVYNLLAAMTVAKMLGVKSSVIQNALKKMKTIDGRFNVFEFGDKRVLVDFAHTPDSIEKTLKLVRQFVNGRIYTIFGCVGYSNRDKRIEMGQVVDNLSDEIILTTDNRGTVAFQDICSDILNGITKCNVVAIEDREDAIKYGLGELKSGDILCVLGKGAENFQMIECERKEYSDLEVVKRLLKV